MSGQNSRGGDSLPPPYFHRSNQLHKRQALAFTLIIGAVQVEPNQLRMRDSVTCWAMLREAKVIPICLPLSFACLGCCRIAAPSPKKRPRTLQLRSTSRLSSQLVRPGHAKRPRRSFLSLSTLPILPTQVIVFVNSLCLQVLPGCIFFFLARIFGAHNLRSTAC